MIEREYRFTFVRFNDGGMEDQNRAIEADSFDEAMEQAQGFCQRHECRISEIEWYDADLQRWQRSTVSYT